MAQPGTAQRASTSALLVRAVDRLPSRADWARIGQSVRGPLLTLAVAIFFDILARNGLPVAHPLPFLMLTVLYSTYRGGLRPGVISAVLAFLYSLHFLSEPGAILKYTPANAYSLLAFGLVLPLTVALMARVHAAALHARAIQVSRAEVEAVERRLAFFAEANATLAASLDYMLTLRNLSRLIVPTLADWCAIHVASEQGTLQFVAGAHRDPA
ncbi:MAG TPA: hypothetical protein VFU40_08965, partial [Gemmatimonadales bacterium]|nr:hypothetical protein [Gemmatimonadales bacterium]